MGDTFSQAGDTDLLARARGGDVRAFDELITRNREKVYMRVYYMIGNAEDALDLTQDVFLRAWKSLPRFDGRGLFSSWVKRIATNAAIDLCRRRKYRPQVEVDEGSMRIDPASHTTPSVPEEPGAGMDRAEVRRRIEEAISRLSPEHRVVMVLKELEDLSYKEIANEVGCSKGTVMSRLFYARRKLQAMLKDIYEEL